MKLSVEEVRKWVQLINDECMSFNEEQLEYVLRFGDKVDAIVLPEDAGVVGYTVAKDFDCKKKMYVVLFYCRPEYRGQYLVYMFRRIEEVAKQEGATSIFIGDSISGYKEKKFNRMLEYFGYVSSGHKKEI